MKKSMLIFWKIYHCWQFIQPAKIDCISFHMCHLSFRFDICSSQSVQHYRAKSYWANSAMASDSQWLLHKWLQEYDYMLFKAHPDSKVHGANMGPIWGRQDPGGPHVGTMTLAIWAGWSISWDGIEFDHVKFSEYKHFYIDTSHSRLE